MSTLILEIVAFIVGLAVIWFGAGVTVKGASSIALKLGLRPIVVGLTVVAFGTSAPELVVSVIAALTNAPDVAIGNVVGSNVANVGLVVGVTCLIAPIASDRSFLRYDMPFLAGAMVLLYLVSFDNLISRFDGAIMFVSLIVYISLTYLTAGKRGGIEDEVPSETAMGKAIIYTILGIAGLTIGARLMVWGAVGMARYIGISELVIGATIVAIGTSLPELATSMVAVLKKQADIGLGNVIGSNIFNICSILGIAPLLMPLPVHSHLLKIEFPVMIGFSVVMGLMMLKRSNKIGRIEGALLALGYAAFLGWSFYTG